MNITYTLSPHEIALRHRKQRSNGFADRFVDRLSSSLMVAMTVAFLAGSLSLSPRITVAVMAIVVALSLYNSRRQFVRRPRYRISIGKPDEGMAVSLTPDGVATTRGAERTSSRWSSLVRFEDTSEGVSLEFIDGTVRWVPLRAFPTTADRQAFASFLSEVLAGTGSPKSAVAGVPMVTLPSGTWQWTMEQTDELDTVITLTDPADRRNEIVANISDEWVEWTAERIANCITRPRRRDFVDREGRAWRIEFTAANVAEARRLDRQADPSNTERIVWVRPDQPADELPWQGLAHVPHDRVCDWFERAAYIADSTFLTRSTESARAETGHSDG